MLFFSPSLKMWKEEGERGQFRGSGNVFFIVERIGRGRGVIFFTNSLWDGGKGAP